MPHLLDALITTVLILAIIVLAVIGTVGFTRSTHTYLVRRKYPPSAVAGLSVLAALVGFCLVWLFYDLWWPFGRLFRRTPKLRIIGPIICVVVILLAIGVFFARGTVYPTFINDTREQITVDNCTLGSVTLKPGDIMKPAVGKHDHACSILQGSESFGCLWLPNQTNGHTIIHLSGYTPISKMTRSCE